MIRNETAEALEATTASLMALSTREVAHSAQKQSLQDKIAAMKAGKKQPTTQDSIQNRDYMSEYKDLAQKLPIIQDFVLEDPESYVVHRLPSHNLVAVQELDKVTSMDELKNTELDINPALSTLKYDDFKKIALAQKSQDITAEILRNHINGDKQLADGVPQLQTALNKLQTLHKSSENISCENVEFNQIQEVVLNNFNHFYPEFNKTAQNTYSSNKDNNKEDISLSKYQQYCILLGQGFIPNTNKPEIRHDLETKNMLYENALQNLPPIKENSNKTAPKQKGNILPKVTVIGDKKKVKQKPQALNPQYDKQLKQEIKKRLQNTK